MKKIFLFTICLLSVVSSFSQARKSKGLIKEVKGVEYRPKKHDRLGYFSNAIKIDDEYYLIGRKIDIQYINVITYITRTKPSDFIIYKLDAKMNVKSVNVIPAMFGNKEVMSYTLKKFGKNLCAFFYFNNRKTLKQYLFAQVVNQKTLAPIGEPYKVGETMITKKEKRVMCIFTIDITSDYNKMLITADRTNIPLTKRERKAARAQKNHTFSYWLINDEFKLINSGKNVKFGKGNTTVIDQTFDNEGNMCLLGFQDQTNTKSKSRKTPGNVDDDEETDKGQSKLVMKIIKPDGTENELSFAEGEYFYSATLKLNPKTGNVAVVGLMSSGHYGASGIFTQQVNLATSEVLTESVQKFGVDYVKEINSLMPITDSKSKKKKKEKEIKKATRKESKKSYTPPDYLYRLVRIGDCHYNDSNELVIVTQKFHTYTVTTTHYDSKGRAYTTTTTYYVYGDIISFKLNNEGVIENFGYVFHYTEYLGDIYKDYSSLYTGSKLFVITKTEGCQVKLDNTVSKTEPFKEYETFKRKRGYADFVNVTDNELLHIMNIKGKKLVFTLMSVNTDN
jgi:hypothetical protein